MYIGHFAKALGCQKSVTAEAERTASAGPSAKQAADVTVNLDDVGSLREYLQRMGFTMEGKDDDSIKADAKRCLEATAELQRPKKPRTQPPAAGGADAGTGA